MSADSIGTERAENIMCNDDKDLQDKSGTVSADNEQTTAELIEECRKELEKMVSTIKQHKPDTDRPIRG